MVRSSLTVLPLLALLQACGATVSSEDALRSHGYSEQYVSGYHDGCASGKNAAGDYFTARTRDGAAYDGGSDYQPGWDYGFVTCRDGEARELAIARAIGAGIAASSTGGSDGIDAQKMLNGMDTSSIRAAGW